ncbi:MAG: sugar ABC transporter permease [Rubellimicrobium sp.]|nr:sugar ABC transporter permease [Rubellimicrobium sp.]
MTLAETTATRPRVRRRSAAAERARRFAAIRPWLFLAPALLVYGGFLVLPMLFTLYTSFYSWDGISPLANMTWVGLENYVRAFTADTVARRAFVNNLFWTAGAVIIPTIIGLFLAIALNGVAAVNRALRTIYYAPAVLPLVAVGLIWGWMYNPNFGAVNLFLREIGLGHWAGGWLSSHTMALPATFITFVWSSVGFPMILYLAGLQTIPRELYEAARIDGASRWHCFRFITLPGLVETHVIVLSLAVINGFKVFDLIYTMTYGGPGRSTHVLGTWMYFQAFQFHNAGYGAALAWIIAAIVLVVAVPYIRRMSRS